MLHSPLGRFRVIGLLEAVSFDVQGDQELDLVESSNSSFVVSQTTVELSVSI